MGQDATQYIPTFADDFNGTALDPTIWSDHHWYAPVPPVTNYAVSGGTLKIWPDQGFVDRDINTDGTFYQTEGFFEIQAKLPVGAGVWPQFWLYNHDTSVRPRVEIMEAYPGGSGWGDANAHPIAYELTTWTDSSGTVAPAGDFRVDTSASDTSQTWHTYGLKWDATSTTFYFDGQQVYTCAATITDRMYILLSLDFGSASGQPSDTATPTGPSNPFEINYVRAWKAGTRTCP